MFISLRLLHAYSITTMTSTILLLNLFPCVCLTVLNRSIYNVVQQKIKVMISLNRRKVRKISETDSNFSREIMNA